MMKKIDIIICILILSFLSLSVYSAIGSISSFYGQSNPFNVSFYDGENHTYFIAANRFSKFENISFNLIFNNTGCYQETPNGTECGNSQLNEIQNNYGVDPQYLFDGNWSSFSNTVGGFTAYVNYSIPSYAEFASWKVKGADLVNHTVRIPDTCFNKTKGKIQFLVESQQSVRTRWFCWNGTDHEVLVITYGESFAYEEAVIFNEERETMNLTIYISNETKNIIEYDINGTNLTRSFNKEIIDNIILKDCECKNCTKNGPYCQIPFIFETSNRTNISLEIINASYIYGLDNCSSFNYTVLNMSYFDDDSNDPITASNSYNLYYTIESSAADQISGSFIDHYSDSICSIVNVSNLGYNYSIYGTFNLQKIGYTTRIYENDIYNAYLSGSPTYHFPMYLLSDGNTSTVYFSIKDIYEKITLLGVQVSMYRLESGEYILVENKLSDIIGKVQFSYKTDEQYKFVFSLSGYQTYTFDANPITSSAYDIYITPTTEIETSQANQRYSYSFEPQEFYIDRQIDFNFSVSSPYSELNYYGYEVTYPGGSVSDYGINPSGNDLQTTFTITEGDITSMVYVTITIDTDLTGIQNVTYSYPLMVSYNYTMASMKDNHFGLKIFERIFVVTMVVIITVGIGALIGQIYPAIAVSFILMGYFVYVQFISVWFLLISIFAGLIMLSARSQ